MRKIIESPAGGAYVGVAKGWLRQLQALRKDLRLPLMDKLILVGGFRIFVRTSDWDDLIWIRGGELRHIITANAAGDIFVYDYVNNILTQTQTTGFSVSTLQQFFSRQNHFNNLFSANNGIGATSITDFGEQITRSLKYERSFLRNGNGIYTRGLETSGLITTVTLSGAAWADLTSGMMGASVALPVEVAGPQWNFYKGIITLGLPVASRNLQTLFKWIPSVFFVQPNDLDYSPGWYYGQRLGWLGVEASVTDLTIDFISLMDTKHEDAESVFGYCERLTDVEGVADGTLNFFLATTPPSDPVDFQTYKSAVGFVYGGTLFQGYNRTFSANPYPGEETTADWWNYAPWADPLDIAAPTEACGVVISTGGKATLYRYNGALSAIYTTDNYHSHSANTLGDKVALFGATDGIITEVTVIDLYGEKFTDGDGVVTGPTFLLREAGNIEGSAADLGEWIPAEKVLPEGELSPVLTYELDDGDLSSYSFESGGMPSLANMSYPETGNGVVNFHNLMVDGTRAVISNTTDECFESVIIVDAAPSGENINHVEGRGTVAGDYSGEKDAVKFTAIGEGLELRREEPSVTADPSTGQVFISGFMGEIVSTTNITAEGFVDYGEDPCSVNISATSSCGQTAGSEVLAIQDPPLSVSVSYSGSTPAQLSASGGIGPYVYSVSCGSVDPDTGVIGDTSACCGGFTGTAEDACGNTETVDIRAADGMWLGDPSKSEDWSATCSFGPGAFVGCDEISGLVKIEWTMHTVVGCPDNFLPPCGIYRAVSFIWYDWVCP